MSVDRQMDICSVSLVSLGHKRNRHGEEEATQRQMDICSVSLVSLGHTRNRHGEEEATQPHITRRCC